MLLLFVSDCRLVVMCALLVLFLGLWWASSKFKIECYVSYAHWISSFLIVTSVLCALCVFYCCVNNARSLRLLVKPLRQWYALPLLLLTVTLVMRALFLVALLLPSLVFVCHISDSHCLCRCFFLFWFISFIIVTQVTFANQTLALFGKCLIGFMIQIPIKHLPPLASA